MSAVVEASLERHAVALPDGLVERALHEVLGRGERDGSFAAGRVDDRSDLPPAAAELDFVLRTELIEPLGERAGMRFTLGYLKAGDGDAPPEETFAPRTMSALPRVTRVLVNLSEYPRRVLLWQREQPDEVLIPGRRCGALHALHYSPEIPHCAINDALGYFMASYEAPI